MSSRSATTASKHLQPENKATPGPEFILGAKPFASGSGRKDEQRKEAGDLLHMLLKISSHKAVNLAVKHTLDITVFVFRARIFYHRVWV